MSNPPEASRECLTSSDYERIFAVLEHCSAAESLEQLKQLLMDALHEHFKFPNTTFLTGPTFVTAFADAEPVTTGRITPIIDEYQALWYQTDVFGTAQSLAKVRRTHAISHTHLGRIPSEARTYLQDFLFRHRLHSTGLMHLKLRHDAHGLVGIFDSEGRELTASHIASLGLLAPQLSNLAKTLPGHQAPCWRDKLTPRQRELADLLADGLTNDEIAATLVLSVDTVKKYVSRIFTLLRVRNRAEFVRLVMEDRLVSDDA